MFTEEKEMKLLDFLQDNKLIYNKCLVDCKDPNKSEALWDAFCVENKMNNEACKRWFKNQKTIYGKITYTKSSQDTPHLMDRQKCLKDNFSFLHTYIVHHFSCKSAFKPARVSRPPDAGPSNTSHQTVTTENMSVELLPLSDKSSSPKEPRRLSGASLTPSQNALSTQPCATPTIK